jgi:hypothetical protein
VANNIKKYSHQDTIRRGGHKNFTKKNKRNALNQKSKTASEKMQCFFSSIEVTNN